MKSTKSKLFIALAFLMLTLSSASCKENSLAGRVYSAMYEGSEATLSFDNDGYANFYIEGKESSVLEYTEKDGTFSGWHTRYTAREFEGKFDDDDLLFIWWEGAPILMHRTDGRKRKTESQTYGGITGRTFQGDWGGDFSTLYFEKFGLLTIENHETYGETQHLFYTDSKKSQEVKIRNNYYSSEYDEEIVFHYDDDFLWGTYDDEEIRLKDLDRVMEANHTLRAEWQNEEVSAPAPVTSAKSSRELTPPKEKHTATYDTLVKYGFRTAEGTIKSDYISISRSDYSALSGIHAVFLNDDGTKCFLDRKYLTQPDYVEYNRLITPKHIDITGCIKEILYATEGNMLRYALVLIECKESEERNILLQKLYAKNMFGDFIEGKAFGEVEKDYSLEKEFADIINKIKSSNDFYYSDNLKWHIEKY